MMQTISITKRQKNQQKTVLMLLHTPNSGHVPMVKQIVCCMNTEKDTGKM